MAIISSEERSPEERRSPLAPELTAQLLALVDIRDEDIDTSDIPEVTTLPAGAVRGLFHRGETIRLKEPVRSYFADLAARKRVPMNDLVNEALEKALAVMEVAK